MWGTHQVPGGKGKEPRDHTTRQAGIRSERRPEGPQEGKHALAGQAAAPGPRPGAGGSLAGSEETGDGVGVAGEPGERRCAFGARPPAPQLLNGEAGSLSQGARGRAAAKRGDPHPRGARRRTRRGGWQERCRARGGARADLPDALLWNPRGLMAKEGHKLCELQEVISQAPPRHILLAETQLDESFSDASIMVPGYIVLRQDRQALKQPKQGNKRKKPMIKQKGGGVLAYVQEDVEVSNVSKHAGDGYEILAFDDRGAGVRSAPPVKSKGKYVHRRLWRKVESRKILEILDQEMPRSSWGTLEKDVPLAVARWDAAWERVKMELAPKKRMRVKPKAKLIKVSAEVRAARKERNRLHRIASKRGATAEDKARYWRSRDAAMKLHRGNVEEFVKTHWKKAGDKPLNPDHWRLVDALAGRKARDRVMPECS
eukprot:gene19302-biopygen21391